MGLAQYAADNWNPDMKKEPVGMGLERYKFANFLKEIYFDSDTTIGLLSGAPFDDPSHWFLSNHQIKQASDTVNGIAGSKRLLFHSLITPNQPGWMDEVDRVIETIKPTSWKGYTIGDPLSPQTTKYPWRLDDEKLMYPFYEKAVRAGITNICIHKGLLPKDYETAIPGGAWRYANADDIPQAAKDWPQINFIIYHAALRAFQENPNDDLAEFERTGYIRWTSDLASIPEKRRQQRLRRHRNVLRGFSRNQSTLLRRDDGHADQGPGCGPCVLGHRLRLVRLAAVADRSLPSSGDSRGHAEGARLRPVGAGRRFGEGSNLRLQRRPALSPRPARRGQRNANGRYRETQGRLSRQWRRPQ
jgi:hypothetical protein